MNEPQTPRPLQTVLDDVGGGSAALAMSPEDFVYIDRDCEEFKLVIQNIMNIMVSVADVEDWRIGDRNPEMVSAGAVVKRFRAKAKGSANDNSVHAVMEQHLRIVEDIQEVHRIARQRMSDTDSAFAAEFDRLNQTLPDRPQAGVPFGPYLLPDGSAR
ncbi:hypothetical protein [Nocardia asteroides]|uniref:hypothetical protein n=1 Tax=Nocardia asteroides TaxID=1824 RepID=UPI001E2F393C|nr:hypothetical protein [Nocardia asteroides]UGT60511.1 hypothetical protein LTT61_25535 [Nocardia asteroides]